MQLDSIFRPTSTNTADGDSVGYFPALISKTYVDGEVSTLKRFTQVKFGYDLRYAAGVATCTVQLDTKLNSSDATWVQPTPALPETSGGAAQKGYRPIALLSKGQGVQFRLVLTAADSFDLYTFQTEVQELRVGRSS
jgi:hypothetical protein